MKGLGATSQYLSPLPFDGGRLSLTCRVGGCFHHSDPAVAVRPWSVWLHCRLRHCSPLESSSGENNLRPGKWLLIYRLPAQSLMELGGYPHMPPENLLMGKVLVSPLSDCQPAAPVGSGSRANRYLFGHAPVRGRLH
ncbi:hypothetical protein HJG60_008449 [Phyllostomus discolor]|uniref:Uncharacterized protein n=1 Tax=Phyllostomus discolor TaxID=89673 RepID=A0A834DND3_9CHIR|nr:hypothetical protein HJG60_008449 [Phyllostomus discolor]